MYTYTHVERFNTPATTNILDNDQVSITCKLDGSNGRVWCDAETEEIRCGSRNRTLTANKDNAGFYAFIHGDSKEAAQINFFLQTHPEYMIIGEWMGQGKFVANIKYYDESLKGKFIIFDVMNIVDNTYLWEKDWRKLLRDNGIDEEFMIKCFGIFDHPTEEQVKKLANDNTAYISVPDKYGEGVVIKAKGYTNQFGEHVYAKYIREDYSASKCRKQTLPLTPGENEKNIIDICVTTTEMNKAIAKTCVWAEVDKFDNHNGKLIGFFLNMVYRESVLEEMPNVIPKLKDPTIDFKLVHSMCNQKCRDYIGL